MPHDTPQVLIIMGVSGSGKTTVGQKLAASLGWTFHDGDNDHPPANIAKIAGGVPLTEADREPWLDVLASRIRNWLAANKHVVLACSALTRHARRKLAASDPRVRFVFLHGSYNLIRERLEQRRGHPVRASLLASQFETLERPSEVNAIEINLDALGSPDAIVQHIRWQLAL